MKRKTFVYASSWNKSNDGSGSFGITGYEFCTETGEMRQIERVEGNVIFNVTHFDKKRGLLYALEEANDLPGLRGGGGGRVFVFKIDHNSGTLTKIGCTETWCTSPCYLTLDKSGNFLLVAHHGSNAAVTKIGQDAFGNYYPIIERDDVAVELFAVNEDGTIGKLLDVEKCTGDGPERKQVHAHPHTTVMSPSGNLFAVCDKGNDTVGMYMLDSEKSKLVRPKHIYRHAPGVLPRYCAFHPQSKWFYHNSESSTRIFAFTYDESGLLMENGVFQAVTGEAEMHEKELEQQGFVMGADGQYIYDIVRGPNLVSVLKVDQTDGSLTVVQQRKIDGAWPRGCAISPDGRFLLVCCRDSGTILEYEIGEDGLLSQGEKSYTQPNAAYVIFCELEMPSLCKDMYAEHQNDVTSYCVFRPDRRHLTCTKT